MPIDASKVAAAVQGGLSIICATCTRYWEGQDRGLPGCTVQGRCGGPAVGDVFHQYDGPISDLSRICFVCGAPPRYAVRVGVLLKRLAVCERHTELVRQWEAAKGREVKVEAAKPPPRKKGLFETILEYEASLQNDGGP